MEETDFSTYYHIGRSCKAEDVIVSLKRALIKSDILLNEIPLIIRSDNGP
ncbi:MAG: hypothetical protein N4A57_17790 [Anaeromicrobium sp.]|jgi:putative transposase|nr:hypothetical protein [Anaeromicrobium sp.]MCT4596103.1 hypothetical protein [Anaeromicrobium sp.]